MNEANAPARARAAALVQVSGACRIAIGAALGLACATASAWQLGPLSLTGFAKDEIGVANNVGTINNNTAPPPTCYGDGREVLPASATRCLPTSLGTMTTPTPMIQATAALGYEFDNATRVRAVLTKRLRNGSNDIVGQNWFEKYVAVSYPTLGTVTAGTQLARAWSRQDGFSYPIGLSTAWSETGAGFGLFPDALRYTSPTFDLPWGKLTLEATYATNHPNNSYVGPNGPNLPPTPRLLELFAQYSNDDNLIELTFETSHGAGQSSWGKAPFVGAANLPVLGPGAGGGTAQNVYSTLPRQSVLILEGDHWFKPSWMVTWGLRHSTWSGASITCGYDPVHNYCTYPSGGFNYADAAYNGVSYQPGYAASTTDGLLGLSYYRGLWTYTAGMVYLGRAHTHNPTQWGQSNWAVITNLGAYRKVPEIMRNLSLYGGFGYVRFGHLGPAPVSMPSNAQFSGINSWVSRSGETFTLGALVTF